mmetsp:Transcript_10019/g.25956  ORF Transcript_10019/g.25956 Transcript_10019/m.25956 type:complete len:262 (-) Transcript_10019:596-1381(-)
MLKLNFCCQVPAARPAGQLARQGAWPPPAPRGRADGRRVVWSARDEQRVADTHVVGRGRVVHRVVELLQEWSACLRDRTDVQRVECLAPLEHDGVRVANGRVRVAQHGVHLAVVRVRQRGSRGAHARVRRLIHPLQQPRGKLKPEAPVQRARGGDRPESEVLESEERVLHLARHRPRCGWLRERAPMRIVAHANRAELMCKLIGPLLRRVWLELVEPGQVLPRVKESARVADQVEDVHHAYWAGRYRHVDRPGLLARAATS